MGQQLAVTIGDGGFVGFAGAAFFVTGAVYFVVGTISHFWGLPRRRP